MSSKPKQGSDTYGRQPLDDTIDHIARKAHFQIPNVPIRAFKSLSSVGQKKNYSQTA